MRLEYIHITNFRSIADQRISCDYPFQILIGINESGKSNILRAVSLLNPSVQPEPNDKRIPKHDDRPPTDSWVRFVFHLTAGEQDGVLEALKSTVLASNMDQPIVRSGSDTLTLTEFCRSRNQALYQVDVAEPQRAFSYWGLPDPNAEILAPWKGVLEEAPQEFQAAGQITSLAGYALVNTEEHPGIPDDYLVELTPAKLNGIVGRCIANVAAERLPGCIVWSYAKENLLPSQIDLAEFAANPDTCVPFKNMFVLAGYDNPSVAIGEAQKSTHGLRNILRKVGDNTTKHMKKVWPEWRQLTVQLLPNGPLVEAGIVDKYNVFGPEQRSEGFKRFFAFLLMISAQARTRDIHNTVIVIDEPSLGLHPTGIRHLREELARIAATNTVLIATHSIFMIDRDVVGRHLIVTRQDEETTVERAGPSSINDEEVLWKALGFSTFELLKPKNIIFEGWRDKKVFECFMRTQKGKGTIGKSQRKALGLLHAQGAKDVARVAGICDSFSRHYVIVTDSDRPAKEAQKRYRGEGSWICYDDIASLEHVTTEDFLRTGVLDRSLRAVASEQGYDSWPKLPDGLDRDRLADIKKECQERHIAKKACKRFMDAVKDRVIADLKPSHISESYQKVCAEIAKRLWDDSGGR